MLQPLIEDDVMVGFELPSLTSLRCDMMKKTGELDREKEFLPSRDLNKVDYETSSEPEQKIEANSSAEGSLVEEKQSKRETKSDADAKPMRDSLSL